MFERYNEIREAQASGDEVGFTLIELLIVIVVLGILAAVVIFGLSGITGQSAQAACNADAKTVEVAVEAYHAQQGQWPGVSPGGDSALTTLVSGIRYLRTFPSNPNHYIITQGATGQVLVQANDGKGNLVAAAADYDVAPNPCLKVG